MFWIWRKKHEEREKKHSKRKKKTRTRYKRKLNRKKGQSLAILYWIKMSRVVNWCLWKRGVSLQKMNKEWPYQTAKQKKSSLMLDGREFKDEWFSLVACYVFSYRTCNIFVYKQRKKKTNCYFKFVCNFFCALTLLRICLMPTAQLYPSELMLIHNIN